jgi:thioredoxin 1
MRLSKSAVLAAWSRATVRPYVNRSARGFKRLTPLALGMLLSAIILLPATICASPSRLSSVAQPSAPPPAAQTAGAGFRPVDLWTEAVLAGDQIGLKRFYSEDSQAYAETPHGKTSDLANEESNFWSVLRSHGLSAVSAKILAQAQPQPGLMQLVLRIELTFRPDPKAANQKTQKMLVSASQVWVRQGNGEWLIGITKRSDVAPMPVITLPQPTVPNTHLYPDPSDAKSELDSATAQARADHKRVLVIFGANWCYDCHVLDATLRSKNVAPIIAANYHVIHISVGDGDSNEDLANRFQIPLKKGIPSLAVLDDMGKLITSQKQGEFESAAKIGMGDVLGFLNRWKPQRASLARQ